MRPVGEPARDVLAAQDVPPLLGGVGLDGGRDAGMLRAWHDHQRRAER